MLVIHIGSPKTGTTAIQGFLKANDAELERHDVKYLKAGRSNIAHNSMVPLLKKGTAGEVIEEITSEMAAAPDATHVMSSEMFFSEQIADALGASLPKKCIGETKIICYLRRPDKYAEAIYKQKVKNGQIPADPPGFLARWQPKLNYSAPLDAYAKVFGKKSVVVRPFERRIFPQGDVVEDFCQHLGLKSTKPFQNADQSSNKSLSAAVSEYLGMVNQFTPFNSRVMIREILAEGAPNTVRAGDVFDKVARQQIIENQKSDCAHIHHIYCPEMETFFDTSDLESDEDTFPGASDRLALERAAAEAVIRAVGRQAKSD